MGMAADVRQTGTRSSRKQLPGVSSWATAAPQHGPGRLQAAAYQLRCIMRMCTGSPQVCSLA